MPGLKFPLLSEYGKRLQTFGPCWAPEGKPAKEDLAASGFFYVNITDCTACIFCGDISRDWYATDDIVAKHAEKNPACLTIRSQCVFPLHPIPKRLMEKYYLFEGFYSRLASFDKWPPQITQGPYELATAGFFYTGIGDTVQCFFCGGKLERWEPDDDPFREHLRWYKDCPFAVASQ